MKDTIRITAQGFVFGNCWGGGRCGYRSKVITGSSMKEVKAIAKEKLASGALDGGMGYESLYGAALVATVETVKIIDDKEFIHTEHVFFTVGRLSHKEKEYSMEAL